MKAYTLLLAVGALIGGLLVYKFVPRDEKIVEKVVFKERVQENVKTVIKEVKRPDGTIEKVTTIDSEKSTKVDSVTNFVVKNNFALELSIKNDNVKSLTIGRRIFGDVYLTGIVDTDKKLGVGILVTF